MIPSSTVKLFYNFHFVVLILGLFFQLLNAENNLTSHLGKVRGKYNQQFEILSIIKIGRAIELLINVYESL